jgi:hypothetical protein
LGEPASGPAGNGLHPRTVFALAVVAVAVCVTGIWWLIFIGDPVQFESPDCSADIESAADIITKGCLDWSEVASTIFGIFVYAVVLLGLPAISIVAARSMWQQAE